MDVARLAKLTHEVNRLYCQLIGDDSQPVWAAAPDWQRASAMSGVNAVLRGIARSPEEQHEVWMEEKKRAGWTYGPIKDPEYKQHPCLVPYEQLPEEQKVKDRLFRAVVLACASLQEERDMTFAAKVVMHSSINEPGDQSGEPDSTPEPSA